MGNHGSVGIIILSALIAGAAVLVAIMTSGEDAPQRAGLAAGEARTASEGYSALDDWRATLATMGLSPTRNDTDAPQAYSAPRGLPASEALARELFAIYAALREDGSVSAGEAEDALAELAAKRIGAFPAPRTYTAQSLTVRSGIAIAAYERDVASAFTEANAVREYELNIFARAMSENRASELARLASIARTYEATTAALVRMPIPEEVVREHLALVNSMSAIAAAVQRLGAWGGDPVDALVLVGAFADAEESLRKSIENLFTFTGILKRRL